MERCNQDIIGMDLGMSTSSVSYMDTVAEIAACCVNAEGNTITPSVIHLETAEKAIVGEVAKECSEIAPDRTASGFKREIGKNQVMLTVDGKSFTAEMLAELQIKALLKDAEAFLERECKKCVITIPVTSDQKYMQAIIQAGKNAGLQNVYLINEAIAAVCNYDSIEDLDGKTIAVIDLGGGTLDIAVAAISKDVIDIVIVLGDANLGGKDWDNALISYIKETYLNGRTMEIYDEQKLVLDVERAKKILSKKNQTRLILSTSEDKESISLTREVFENCTSHLLKKVEKNLEELKRELDEKNISKLDKLYLVGGSTKMPQIKDLVERVFPKVSIASKNPDEAVALGAAVYAKRISASQKEMEIKHSYRNKELKTVSARSYGIAVQLGDDGEKKIFNMIPRGTQLPITVARSFYTKEKNQKEVTMRIYESMSKDTLIDIDKKELLGTGQLKIQKSLPKYSSVGMKFTLGLDGVLVIEGEEKKGNTKAKLILEGTVA